MRVMSYNILKGGDQALGDRTDLIVEVVQRADPDILGLCECTGWDAARLQAFGRRVGMTGSMNTAPSGAHVALLHKPAYYAEFGSVKPAMHNGFVKATVAGHLGAVEVVVTHLQPHSSLFRLMELQIILGRALGPNPSVVMGDLNNVAAGDLPARASERVLARMRGVTSDVDTAPIDMLLARGMVDLGAGRCGPTYKTRIKDPEPSVRLDYVFATAALAQRCVMFDRPDDDLAHRASDHLPVIADFE